MSDLTPDEFEEEKYVDYFPKLQTAYKSAFETMNGSFDSDVVHGIDQTILAESEPHYEGDGEFTVELPDDPLDELDGVVATDEKTQHVLDRYLEELRAELRAQFDVGEDV